MTSIFHFFFLYELELDVSWKIVSTIVSISCSNAARTAIRSVCIPAVSAFRTGFSFKSWDACWSKPAVSVLSANSAVTFKAKSAWSCYTAITGYANAICSDKQATCIRPAAVSAKCPPFNQSYAWLGWIGYAYLFVIYGKFYPWIFFCSWHIAYFFSYLLYSYTFLCILQFAPSSFGQPQNSINTLPQFQPMSQMHAPPVPVAGQPWMSSVNQSVGPVTPVQQAGQHPSVSSSTDSVSFFFFFLLFGSF